MRTTEPTVTVTRCGRSIEVARDVAAAPAVAADALRDSREWPAWSPLINGVESEDRYVRAGTRGRVRIGCGWVPFRVTAFNGRRWDWTVAGVPATGHRVDTYAGEPNRCRVVIEVPIPAAAYVPTCKRALRRFVRLLEDGRFAPQER